MKLTIEIECHDDDEMLDNLSWLRALVKRKLIRHQNDTDFYLPISDNNCAGTIEGSLQDGNPILPLGLRRDKARKKA